MTEKEIGRDWFFMGEFEHRESFDRGRFYDGRHPVTDPIDKGPIPTKCTCGPLERSHCFFKTKECEARDGEEKA